MFLKKSELGLINGGYLVEVATSKPVSNKEFVARQTEAHYLVSLAGKVGSADLKGKKATTFDELVKQVQSELADKTKKYVTAPEAVKTPTLDALQKEAMAWLEAQKGGNVTDKVNNILQKFNLIADFEEFGLFFNDADIVKLDKIYTMEEIIAAVTVLAPHLDEK